MMVTRFYYLNELGSKKNQEDFIWPYPHSVDEDSKIFIVCDGVGGSSKGEVASRLVAEYVGNALLKTDIATLSIEYINGLLEEARNVLSEYARAQQTGTDMATTFSLLALYAKRAFISWCGDSRVYHFRSGKVIYKTEDHSLVNSLVKAGEISEADAVAHPQKNVILKAIKADSPLIEAEGGWSSTIEAGDYFLLCTDGLLENWRDEALSALLTPPYEDNINLANLIQEKSLNNTRDNYSMYLLKIKADQEKQVSPKKNRIAGTVFFVVLLASAVAAIVYYTVVKRKDPVINTVTKTVTDSIVQQPIEQVPKLLAGDSGARTKDTAPGVVLAPVQVQIINPVAKDSLRKNRRDSITEKVAGKKILKDTAIEALPRKQVPAKQHEDSVHTNL